MPIPASLDAGERPFAAMPFPGGRVRMSLVTDDEVA